MSPTTRYTDPEWASIIASTITALKDVKRPSYALPKSIPGTIDHTLLKLDATPAQIAIAWVLDHPGVSAIPKTATPARIAENRAGLDVALTDDDRAARSDPPHVDPVSRFRRDPLTAPIPVQAYAETWRPVPSQPGPSQPATPRHRPPEHSSGAGRHRLPSPI